ncbi:MAG: efflux transporter periplasmic adaptor subunit [Flavobacteriaceae bacterium]|nr:MAG: efflux transporter periplasmic adaptor subunit [Flavobacteriaceae bacterium]
MKNTITIILLMLLITISSCSNKETKIEVQKQVSIQAVIATVSTNTKQEFTSSTGKIAAANSANISTRMMGFVTKISVKVGDKVRKGQVLIQINSNDIDAQNAQVSANILEASEALKNTEKNYHRFKSLFESNSASQKEMDDITTQYNMSKAHLSAAKAKKAAVNALLAYTTIRAPFSGIITNTYVKNGDMASPGNLLISMESPNNYEVNTMVSENIIGQISKNMNVDVLLKSTHKTIKGMVSEISTSSNNTGGQYLVKIQLDASEKNMLSGMYVSVQFPITSNKTATKPVLIPSSALVKKGELVGVYTVNKDNVALLRWLRVGRNYGDHIQILAGLSEGESYVLSSEFPIHNGVQLLIKK